jgi:hypothetical protein
MSQTEFCGTPRTELFKTHKTVTNSIQEYIWTVWPICTLPHQFK